MNEPNEAKLTTRLPADLIRNLRILSAYEGSTMQAIIIDALTDYINDFLPEDRRCTSN